MPTFLTASGSDPCNATFSASVSPSVDVPRHAVLDRDSSREDWNSSMSECGSTKISWRLPFRSTEWGRLGFCTHQIMADLHPALIIVWGYSNSVGSIGPKWTASKISDHKTWRLQSPSCNTLGQMVEGVIKNNKIYPAKIRMTVKIINRQYLVPQCSTQNISAFWEPTNVPCFVLQPWDVNSNCMVLLALTVPIWSILYNWLILFLVPSSIAGDKYKPLITNLLSLDTCVGYPCWRLMCAISLTPASTSAKIIQQSGRIGGCRWLSRN